MSARCILSTKAENCAYNTNYLYSSGGSLPQIWWGGRSRTPDTTGRIVSPPAKQPPRIEPAVLERPSSSRASRLTLLREPKLAQECKGCVETLCKGCHETEHPKDGREPGAPVAEKVGGKVAADVRQHRGCEQIHRSFAPLRMTDKKGGLRRGRHRRVIFHFLERELQLKLNRPDRIVRTQP